MKFTHLSLGGNSLLAAAFLSSACTRNTGDQQIQVKDKSELSPVTAITAALQSHSYIKLFEGQHSFRTSMAKTADYHLAALTGTQNVYINHHSIEFHKFNLPGC